MKRIKLTQGKFALVDDEDFEWLNERKWCAAKTTYGGFIADSWDGKLKRTIRMHREITNAPKGLDVDHKNHDTLDNRRENLRVCTRSQNLSNQRKTRGSSKYKGVSWFKRRKKFQAYIKKNSKHIGLGYYANEVQAAKAYDKKAKELFGEFACLNFPERG